MRGGVGQGLTEPLPTGTCMRGEGRGRGDCREGGGLPGAIRPHQAGVYWCVWGEMGSDRVRSAREVGILIMGYSATSVTLIPMWCIRLAAARVSLSGGMPRVNSGGDKSLLLVSNVLVSPRAALRCKA